MALRRGLEQAPGQAAGQAPEPVDVVTCARCGSRVPDRRTRCGRCGSTATVVASAPASGLPISPRLMAIGGVAVVVVGVGAWSLAPRTDVSAAANQTRPSAVTASVASTAAGERRTTEPRATTPEDVTSADYQRSGVAAYNWGDLATAEAKLTEAVRSDPDDAGTLDQLGQVLVRAGKARDAIQYFDRAIALGPDEWKYRFNRGRALAELQDWSRAIQGYQDAVRLFPSDYVTHFNLARAREASGDLAGAIESYGKAVELAPGQADFRLWHGRALDRAGRAHDAVAEYKQFLELEPDAPQAEKVKARLVELAS